MIAERCAGVGVADKEPVFLADGRRAGSHFRPGYCRGGFRRSAGGCRAAPTGTGGSRRPSREPTWAAPGCGPLRQPAQALHGAGEALGLLPFPAALPGFQLLLVPCPFHSVHPADQAQGRLRHPGVFALGLKKAAPGMRPASDPGDRGMLRRRWRRPRSRPTGGFPRNRRRGGSSAPRGGATAASRRRRRPPGRLIDPKPSLHRPAPLFIGIDSIGPASRRPWRYWPRSSRGQHPPVDRLQPVRGDPHPVGHRLPAQRRPPTAPTSPRSGRGAGDAGTWR